MRLSTITNWAYGATVALTLASGTTMLLASHVEEEERAAVAQRAVFDQMTATLEEDVYRLSEQARGFVVTGNLICPPLSGPETMIVWTTKGTMNAEQEAQAGRDYRQAA